MWDPLSSASTWTDRHRRSAWLPPSGSRTSSTLPGLREKLLYFVEDVLALPLRQPAFWQRVQKNLAVSFVHDTTVEDHDRPAIAFATNQTPEALLEFDYRLWDAVF